MRRRKKLFCAALLVVFALPLPLLAVDVTFSDDVYMYIKGDASYSAKIRTEDPNLELPAVPSSTGNKNFKKGDLVNNKMMLQLEMQLNMPNMIFRFQGEAFYDHVYNDDDLYPNPDTDVAEAKRHTAYYIAPQEFYLDFYTDYFSLRAGRQIVEWGELSMPVQTPGVGVVNIIDMSKVGSSGYTFRDMKVPNYMAWASYEMTSWLSLEGIYAPYFDPRYSQAVVGTYNSFTDMMGWGSPHKDCRTELWSEEGKVIMKVDYNDGRPTRFEDMQQFGGAIRPIFSSLNNLEMGLYYFRYLNWMPMMKMDIGEFTYDTYYEEVDMYGMTLSQVIDALGTQVFCELTYRPNDLQQLAEYMGPMPVPIGFVRTRTLNWGFGGMKMISDAFSFTPWIIQVSPTMEFYGGYNIEYDEKLDKNSKKKFLYPKHRAYYVANIMLMSADMIENTKLTMMIMGMGSLHQETNTMHSFNVSLQGKIGDLYEIMLGYELNTGKDHEVLSPPLPDHDAFSFAFTLYLN